MEEATIARRRAAVSQLETSGYGISEIADSLHKLHTKGDTSLFRFVAEDRHTPLPAEEIAKLSYAQVHERIYDVVRKDLRVLHREDLPEPDAESASHERWLLIRRLRKMLQKIDGALHGLPDGGPTGVQYGTNDPKEIAALAKPGIECAVRLARLGGIESDKPIEIKLPEFYVARIDEDGVVHVEQQTPPEQPN